MNDYEYFSSLYTPLHFHHEIRVGEIRVPLLVQTRYRVDMDGSMEICNLKYWSFGDERSLRKLEPFYDEIIDVLEKKAFKLIRNRPLKDAVSTL